MPLPPPAHIKILVRLTALELFVGRLYADRLSSLPDPKSAFFEFAERWRTEARLGTGRGDGDPALTDLAADELAQQVEQMLRRVEEAILDNLKP